MSKGNAVLTNDIPPPGSDNQIIFLCTNCGQFSALYIKREPTYFHLFTCYSLKTIVIYSTEFIYHLLCTRHRGRLCGEYWIIKDKILALRAHISVWRWCGFNKTYCFKLIRSRGKSVSAIISLPPHVLFYIQLKSWHLIDHRTIHRASFMSMWPV